MAKRIHQSKKPEDKGSAEAPRERHDPRREVSLNLILNETERLMLAEGYAAVTSRRVAKEAGLKAPLVHYYFPTTDDLFLAVFRRAVVEQLDKLEQAAASPDTLLEIWRSYKNSDTTALALEFMALANHRKAIRDEIAAYTEKARRRRAEVLTRLMKDNVELPPNSSMEGVALLLVGVARTLVMEEGLGINVGHAEANAFVEWWLEKLKRAGD